MDLVYCVLAVRADRRDVVSLFNFHLDFLRALYCFCAEGRPFLRDRPGFLDLDPLYSLKECSCEDSNLGPGNPAPQVAAMMICCPSGDTHRRERKRRELAPSRTYNFSLSKPRIPGREPGDRLSGPQGK